MIAKPGRFLSAVQIGITLVGIGAGVFSGVDHCRTARAQLLAYGLSVACADFRPWARGSSPEWRFEIADLDGLRIDKVIGMRIPPLHRKLQ